MHKLYILFIACMLGSCAWTPEKLYQGKKQLHEIAVIEGYSVPMTGQRLSHYYVHFSSIASVHENKVLNATKVAGKVLHVEPGRYLVTTYCFYDNGFANIHAEPIFDISVEAGKKYIVICENTETQETVGQLVPVRAVVGEVTSNAPIKGKNKK